LPPDAEGEGNETTLTLLSQTVLAENNALDNLVLSGRTKEAAQIVQAAATILQQQVHW